MASLRSYYSNTITQFLSEDERTILGELSKYYSHALEYQQKRAWTQQITILKNQLQGFEGQIYFEFSIPRMGKRVDNILIIKDFIFVLEFKVGDKEYKKHCIDQVEDYCLDLQNFHKGSHQEKIVPILIATKAKTVANSPLFVNKLSTTAKVNKDTLGEVIIQYMRLSDDSPIDYLRWQNSKYEPVPTIVEAAKALYIGHDVAEISRNNAGDVNLARTTDYLNQVINDSKHNNEKSICFVTGVPGAGKTLAGLNIANQRLLADENEHAIFLSGNGPLVKVLSAALAKSDVKKARQKFDRKRINKAFREITAFIQNIHQFRDHYWEKKEKPNEKVVVFDEAQRAWNKEKSSDFMSKKWGEFTMSEPEFLIDVMDRHKDWCAVICLVGGGQEINTGEAGLTEWLHAIRNHYPHWHIHYSNLIATDSSYLSDADLRHWLQSVGKQEQDLHLAVPVRSFRSEQVSLFVHQILEGHAAAAHETLAAIQNDFPVYLTRSLDTAKNWLRGKARGTERIGIVASSGARRLRSLGLDVRNEIEATSWFLNNADYISSSNYLEVVATEFHIQGLEIDWVCLAWEINFYRHGKDWIYKYFHGNGWRDLDVEAQSFLKNAYRVLLTRARQGLIIYVPHGDDLDATRPKELYDGVFEYLRECGIEVISNP